MPDYPVGPGHARTTGGAVVEAYVDTNALDYECPACGVKVAEFCRWDTGRQRRAPCPRRIAVAAKAVEPVKKAANCAGCGSTDPHLAHYAHCPTLGEPR